MRISLVRLQTNFYAGLAIILPAAISIAVLIWLYNTAANVTSVPFELPLKLLFHREQLYDNAGHLFWYWKLFGLLMAVLFILGLGALARYYIGKRLITLFHMTMLRIPLLNKIYAAMKQVNDAFTSSKKSSFKQVVLVEFPKDGLYSIGFITGDEHQEIQAKTKEKVMSVFVPTTPNPTTGFLILVAEEKIVRLQMPVADGIKYIVSLGSYSPPFPQGVLNGPTPLPALESLNTGTAAPRDELASK